MLLLVLFEQSCGLSLQSFRSSFAKHRLFNNNLYELKHLTLSLSLSPCASYAVCLSRFRFFLKEFVCLRMKGGKGKGATKKEASLKLVDDRKLGKRKAAVKPSKNSKRAEKKKKIAKKDPNKPKRPPSAFFVFLEEFRKTYKQEHPNVKSVSVVGKAGGEKWKSMSDAEKAPFEAKAAKKKSEYEKLISAYNKKQESVADDGDEESDRSKSEMNDDEDEEDVEEEEEEDDDDDDDE